MSEHALKKINAIDKKIELLRQQQIKLTANIETKIIDLLKKEKAFYCDFEILYGAIYELAKKLKNLDSQNFNDSVNIEIAKWKKSGAELLTKSKSQQPRKIKGL